MDSLFRASVELQTARARLRAAVRLLPPAEDLKAVQELQEAGYLPEASVVLHTAGAIFQAAGVLPADVLQVVVPLQVPWHCLLLSGFCIEIVQAFLNAVGLRLHL